MVILGIDTSCDDTSIGIVKIKENKIFFESKVLSNTISSQIKIHKKYGGVYPFLAKREHKNNFLRVFKRTLKKSGLLEKRSAKLKKIKIKDFLKDEKILKRIKSLLKEYKKPKIDLISVTIGPGLDPCLWVGINFAKILSSFWKIKTIGINHIEAHFLANFLNKKIKKKRLKSFFPAISLIVSGATSQLILIKKIGDYKILGQTRDDAAGECLDKTARILGFSYPGGPIIEKLARDFSKKNKFSLKLPRPMINSKDYDFSFSGLKTAVLYKVKKRFLKNKLYLQAFAFEIQNAVFDVLIKKTIKAIKDYKVKSLFLGGGVSRNKEFKKRFQKAFLKSRLDVNFFVPNSEFCSDNGAMVAISGFFHKNSKVNLRSLKSIPNLKIDERIFY